MDMRASRDKRDTESETALLRRSGMQTEHAIKIEVYLQLTVTSNIPPTGSFPPISQRLLLENVFLLSRNLHLVGPGQAQPLQAIFVQSVYQQTEHVSHLTTAPHPAEVVAVLPVHERLSSAHEASRHLRAPSNGISTSCVHIACARDFIQ